MCARSALLEALGDEEGCRRLSAAFYARVGNDPVLRPLFPGKNLRCATEEFAAFLIQFLGGDEKQTQYRWWLSLRESHARFQIGPNARRAWLRHMEATLDAAPLDEATRNALRHFSRAVPPMSLEGILPSRIMKIWMRVGASSGFWIALSQPLWKAETMKRSLSHHALPLVHRCSWDYWHG